MNVHPYEPTGDHLCGHCNRGYTDPTHDIPEVSSDGYARKSDELGSIFLRRNRATAAEIERILGLPNGMWTNVTIAFGLDDPAIATVGLIINKDQLKALAELGHEAWGLS